MCVLFVLTAALSTRQDKIFLLFKTFKHSLNVKPGAFFTNCKRTERVSKLAKSFIYSKPALRIKVTVTFKCLVYLSGWERKKKKGLKHLRVNFSSTPFAKSSNDNT